MGSRRKLGFAITGVAVGVVGISLSLVGFASSGSRGPAGEWPILGMFVAIVGAAISAFFSATIED